MIIDSRYRMRKRQEFEFMFSKIGNNVKEVEKLSIQSHYRKFST